MSIFSHLAKKLRKITGKNSLNRASQSVDANPSSRDATSAIEELSRAVQNDTDSVEIYLALGNLFRLRGDIEKAVHIRRCLIARPGLESSFRARAFFELGRDYRRGGFIDRAQNSFNDALKHGADKQTVWCELAALYGDSGAFDQAAIQHRRIGNTVGEAHYLTRHAEELYKAGQSSLAQKVLIQAIKAYSGSIEAWIIRISIAIQENQWTKASSLLSDAMKHIALEKRFLVFHAILELPNPKIPSDSSLKNISEADSNPLSETGANSDSEAVADALPKAEPSSATEPCESADSEPDSHSVSELRPSDEPEADSSTLPKADVKTLAESPLSANDVRESDVTESAVPESNVPESNVTESDLVESGLLGPDSSALANVDSKISSELESDTLAQSDVKNCAMPQQAHKKTIEITEEAEAITFEQIRCNCVLPIIEAQEADLLLHYYAALFLLQCHKQEEANIWLEKAIVLQSNFWAARHQILLYSVENEQLSPVFKGQLTAMMDQAKGIKRFVCQHCGFKSDQTFYLCPKCRSWHSATFRISLQN